jgi:hypothetical protein
MNLDAVVPRSPQAPRRVEEVALDRVNLVDTQRAHRFAGGGMASGSGPDRFHPEYRSPQ